MNKLGLFIREKRLNLALTQKEFAERLGISNVTLSKIERGGRIGSMVLKLLSKYFSVSTKLLREMMVEKIEDN